jgi:deoxyribodipyrimidine photo-lyase
MIQKERIRELNRESAKDRGFVLYWMQAAQRVEYNHALEFAIRQANQRHKPALAVFSLTDDFPEANLRHYTFMLQGLLETKNQLAERGIQFVILHGAPEKTILPLAQKADLLVTDDGYLRIQRKWRKNTATAVDCAAYEVVTSLIVPAEEASDKENFSAGTFRPRITKQLAKYLVPLKHTKPAIGSLDLQFKSFDIADIDKSLSKLKIDRSVAPSPLFTGGTQEAKQRLRYFIAHQLNDYADKRNDPIQDCQSHMSPYLHFGQISPLYIALQITDSDVAEENKDAYLEELIVRRELSHNFVRYNARYDAYDALPPWALRTLNFHAKDKRDQTYTLDHLEFAQTGDAYWNAAQMEMVLTGKMHNYMRMYWGKRILEWTPKPRDAFNAALYLNNKYEIDGRDPNGFTGVAWCFGKHDRAWTERRVFGKIRYMNAAGLKRKFDIDAYVRKIDQLGSKYSEPKP